MDQLINFYLNKVYLVGINDNHIKYFQTFYRSYIIMFIFILLYDIYGVLINIINSTKIFSDFL